VVTLDHECGNVILLGNHECPIEVMLCLGCERFPLLQKVSHARSEHVPDVSIHHPLAGTPMDVTAVQLEPSLTVSPTLPSSEWSSVDSLFGELCLEIGHGRGRVP
jgi:hypothetical protein